MVGFQGLPEQLRNSGYHARLWNRRSGGWASTSTARTDPPLINLIAVISLTVRHFAEHAAPLWCPPPFLSTVSGWRFGCSVLMRRCSMKRRTTMTQTSALEIVWRNPKPPQRRQRWEQVNEDSGAARYLVQEVATSIGWFWMTTLSLEFVPGGRAASCCPRAVAHETTVQRRTMA
jgi:hypothetical protein